MYKLISNFLFISQIIYFRPTHCYLVLDILNSTTHEMELQYASNKRILIEAHDICRIPVSVERCPLSGYDKYLDICGAQRKSNVLAACRNHLVNLVDLQWTLISFQNLISVFSIYSFFK